MEPSEMAAILKRMKELSAAAFIVVIYDGEFPGSLSFRFTWPFGKERYVYKYTVTTTQMKYWRTGLFDFIAESAKFNWENARSNKVVKGKQ